MKVVCQYIACVAVSLLIIGCATSSQVMAPDLMVHTSEAEKKIQIAETLSIASVESDNQSAYTRKPIDIEVFKQALVHTLQESGLFVSVSSDPGSSFTLESEIIYQAPVDAYSVTLPLLVHYKLRKTATGEVALKINTFSQPRIPYKKSEAGPTGQKRHDTVVRAAIRDSFKQLLTSLRQAAESGL